MPIKVKDQDKHGASGPDDVIINEAKRRFTRCEEWEANFRRLYVEDVKFANGDSDNGWQWPDGVRSSRALESRPCLTINKTQPHCLLIVNDARQNKPSITVRPAGEDSSYKAAQIYEGLVRYIEYISSAQTIYDSATTSQVEGGIGYWRIVTRYIDETSFNQDIIIAPVRDHLSVYLDPDIKMVDGSDAKFGFIFEDIPREDFEVEYPSVDLPSPTSVGTGVDNSDGWETKDSVRVCEYYRITMKHDELIYLEDENGIGVTFRRSDIPKNYKKLLDEAEANRSNSFRSRPLEVPQLEWFKIAGSKIIERRKLKGSYIPIARLVGRERVVDGKLERKGHVRTMKDPQRMYNYNSSAQVEFGALQSKTPWVAPAAAIEGNERAWANSNTSNLAYLSYRHSDEDGNPIPPPMRPEPPGVSTAFVQGMQIAATELEMVSNQYQAQMGQPSNERSGRAIGERQRQSDIANYDFADMLAAAIRHTAKIIIDLAPHIYDTERVVKILDRDGTVSDVSISPNMAEDVVEQQRAEKEVKVLFNPKVGKYEVHGDIGPSYSTQRQEAWNAFVQMSTQAPHLIEVVGDLMFKSADFPLADKISDRLRRKIKMTAPALFDEGDVPDPRVVAITQQMQQKDQMIAELLERLAETNLKLKNQSDDREIDAFDAETRRLTAVSNAQPELARLGQSDQLEAAITKVLKQMMGHNLDGVIAENSPEGDRDRRETADMLHGGASAGVATLPADTRRDLARMGFDPDQYLQNGGGGDAN